MKSLFLSLIVQLAATAYSLAQSGVTADSLPAMRHSAEVGFRSELYRSPYRDRTFTYLQYGNHHKRVDAFVRVMRYTLGDNDAWLTELDIYPKFRKNGYAYINAAYSDQPLFPNYRLRAEIFRNYKRFEFSLGGGVVKPKNYSEIPLITGTVGYYFGNYFVYARPSVSFLEDGTASSFLVCGRRYFSRTDFIELSLLRGRDAGTGRNFNAVENSFGLETYVARMGGRLVIGRYKLGAGVDYGGWLNPAADEYARFIGLDFFINRMF